MTNTDSLESSERVSSDNMTSPFIVGGMITDPARFWGRKQELLDIWGRLKKMHSTSIIGPRRIGKSSLAFYLYKIGNLELGGDYEFVWLDGQSNHSTSVQQFFKEIAKNSSLAYTTADDLTDCLINFEDAVKGHSPRLVIIINEFELLTDAPHQKAFTIDFYNTLRLLAELSHLALVTTSKASLKELCMHVLGVSSPFYNIFEEKTLQHLTTEEAEAFLAHSHDGVTMTPSEVQFIQEEVKFYQHPLVLQIACDSVYQNREIGQSETELLTWIEKRVNHYSDHKEVEEGRRLETKRAKKDSNEISKPLDMVISILIPVAGIGLLMLEFGLLIRALSTIQTVLLALVTAILGFAVLIFAGRSVDVIGESTFYKLFSQLIKQIPLLSNLADQIVRLASKSKEEGDTEE